MARPALAATRAVAVLNFLAAHPREEFSLSDLAGRLDINLASTHAILNALNESGYVVRHPRLRTYGLGPSVAALGSATLDRHPAIRQAREEGERLSRATGLGVAVTARAGDDIVFLERVGAHRPRDIGAHPGQRIPLDPPFGSVFVAWQDSERWLARSRDRAAMEAVLDAVRARGWAVAFETDQDGRDDPASYHVASALDGDHPYDVVMIAAPVFGPAGDALVALTLLGFEPGLPAGQIVKYGEQVRDAGLVATRRSGGRPPTKER